MLTTGKKRGYSQPFVTGKAKIIHKAPDFSFLWIYTATFHSTPMKTPCLQYGWTMTKHPGWAKCCARPGRAGEGGHGMGGQCKVAESFLEVKQSDVWSLNLEATFPIPSPPLFSHGINLACAVLLFLRLSQDELAFVGRAVIWEHSILYKGSLYVKQKHFCFAFQLGWVGRIDLFFLQSEKTKPRDYTNVGSIYQFHSEIKHNVTTQCSIFPWLKCSCLLNCYTGYCSVWLTCTAVISHNSLAPRPTKHKLSWSLELSHGNITVINTANNCSNPCSCSPF